MSKFKVGDKVRVKGLTSISAADKKTFIGREFTVSCLTGFDWWPYSLTGDAGRWNWSDDELELADFTKADLKDGMVVDFRNGERRIVLNGRFMINNVSMPITCFGDDLCHNAVNEWSVDKVYTSDAIFGCEYFKDHHLTLIWERKEEPKHKEMTVEEIEEKLGYKIKVVADK